MSRQNESSELTREEKLDRAKRINLQMRKDAEAVLEAWRDMRAICQERLGWSSLNMIEKIRLEREGAGRGSRGTVDDKGDPVLTLSEKHAHIFSQVMRAESVIEGMPFIFRRLIWNVYINGKSLTLLAAEEGIALARMSHRFNDAKEEFIIQYQRKKKHLEGGEKS